jgi:hypothetical protein
MDWSITKDEWYRKTIYGILYLFTAIEFPPGGSGLKTCTKIGKRQLYIKGETIHKTIQNTQNRKQTY